MIALFNGPQHLAAEFKVDIEAYERRITTS